MIYLGLTKADRKSSVKSTYKALCYHLCISLASLNIGDLEAEHDSYIILCYYHLLPFFLAQQWLVPVPRSLKTAFYWLYHTHTHTGCFQVCDYADLTNECWLDCKAFCIWVTPFGFIASLYFSILLFLLFSLSKELWFLFWDNHIWKKHI